MILASIPIVSFGWFKRNGLNFETYIKHLFKYHLSAGVRKKKVTEPKDKNEQIKLGGQET